MNRVLSRLTRAAADPGPRPDGHLLDAFLAERSEAAFRELVARHGELVFAVCQRVLRHRQDAEDAFQAVFLVLARRAADVWPREALGAWLHGVAHRVALKARALRARRRVCEQPLGEQSPPSPAASAAVDLAELIDAAVRKLPEVYRAAVVACDLEGLSRAEAASRLGWKEGTLSGRLARARKLLADRLRRSGVAVPAAGLGAALGKPAVAEAVVAETVRLAVGCGGGNLAAGVSGSVAVLTEGVVRGMFMAKIKAAAIAVLAVGVFGVGVWAATGPGDGQGPGKAAGNQPNPAAKAKGSVVKPADRHPDLEAMQGTWWIVAIGDGNKVDPVDPNAQRDPRQFAVTITDDRFYFPSHPAFRNVIGVGRITLDPTRSPKHIDIAHEGGTFPGVYEFVALEAKDHVIQLRMSLPHAGGARSHGFMRGGLRAIEMVLAKFADPLRDPATSAGIAPGGANVDLATAEEQLRIAHQELESTLKWIKERDPAKDLDRFEVLVAQDKVKIDQVFQLLDRAEAEVAKARLRTKPAPTLPAAGQKLSGDLARMQGRWRVDSRWNGMRLEPVPAKEAPMIEIVGDEWYNLYGEERRREKPAHTLALRQDNTFGEIDLASTSGGPVARGIYAFPAHTTPRAGELWIALATGGGPRPTSFDPKAGGDFITFVRVAPAETDDTKPHVVEGVNLTPAQHRRDLVFQELQLFIAEIRNRRPATTVEEFADQLEREKNRAEQLLQLIGQAQKELDREKARAKAAEPPKAPGNLLDEAKARRATERQRLTVVLDSARHEVLAAQNEKTEAGRQAQRAERELAAALRSLEAAQKALDVLGTEETRSTAALEIRDDKNNRVSFPESAVRGLTDLATAMLAGSRGELTGGKNAPFATAQRWQQLQKSGHLVVRFPTKRVVVNGAEVEVAEILVPASGTRSPEYVLVRSGDSYRAFFDFPADHAERLQKVLGALGK